MRIYRVLTGGAAGLIALAGLVSVTAGGDAAVPPPVVLRGASPPPTPAASDGLEFVPATVVELGSPPDEGASVAAPTTLRPPPTDRADPPETTWADSPVTAENSPDDAGDIQESDSSVTDDVTSADTAITADDSPESADSPDD